MHAREAGQRSQCSIGYASAVVDLISQSRARARPPRLRLARAPAAVEAVVACTGAAVLRVEQEPGSTAQERRCFGGAVDHGTVASVSGDQNWHSEKTKTYRDLRLPVLQRRIRGNRLAGYTFHWRVDIL